MPSLFPTAGQSADSQALQKYLSSLPVNPTASGATCSMCHTAPGGPEPTTIPQALDNVTHKITNGVRDGAEWLGGKLSQGLQGLGMSKEHADVARGAVGGAGEFVGGLGDGLEHVVAHPVDTAVGAYNAVRHPLDTADALKQDFNRVREKDGLAGALVYTAGNVVTTVAGGVGAVKTVGSIASKVSTLARGAEVADIASNTARVGEVGGAIRNAEAAPTNVPVAKTPAEIPATQPPVDVPAAKPPADPAPLKSPAEPEPPAGPKGTNEPDPKGMTGPSEVKDPARAAQDPPPPPTKSAWETQSDAANERAQFHEKLTQDSEAQLRARTEDAEKVKTKFDAQESAATQKSSELRAANEEVGKKLGALDRNAPDYVAQRDKLVAERKALTKPIREAADEIDNIKTQRKLETEKAEQDRVNAQTRVDNVRRMQDDSGRYAQEAQAASERATQAQKRIDSGQTSEGGVEQAKLDLERAQADASRARAAGDDVYFRDAIDHVTKPGEISPTEGIKGTHYADDFNSALKQNGVEDFRRPVPDVPGSEQIGYRMNGSSGAPKSEPHYKTVFDREQWPPERLNQAAKELVPDPSSVPDGELTRMATVNGKQVPFTVYVRNGMVDTFYPRLAPPTP